MAKLRRSDITQNTILPAMGAAHRQNEKVQALKGRNITAMGVAHRQNRKVQALKGRNITAMGVAHRQN